MGNIISYLKWRGDVTLQVCPFNEVDNLILSELAYLDFRGMIPDIESAQEVTSREVWDKYREKNGLNSSELLEVFAKSRRFETAVFSKYQDIYDTGEDGTQFAALKIGLEDGSCYIAFRGTDLSIIGWREDFRIGYEIVPAQRYAQEYLSRIFACSKEMLRIGGHSKGGNLAVYAAMMCPDKWKERILEIYNNDGPGLCQEFRVSEEYDKIREKIRKIVPEFSIVGQLFEDCETQIIVKSNTNGFLQHASLNWQVEGCSFIICDELDPKCRNYNELFDRWLEQVDIPTRKIFVNDLFGALLESGADTLDEIARGGLQKWEQIMAALGKTRGETKRTAGNFAVIFWDRIKKADIHKFLADRKNLPGILLMILGMVFLIFSEYTLRVLGSVFFAGLFGYSVYRVYHMERERGKGVRPRKLEMVYLLIAAVELLCLFIDQVPILSTGLALSVFWIYRSYRQGWKTIRCKRKHGGNCWIAFFADTIISIGFTVISVTSLGDVNIGALTAMGSFLIIAGLWDTARSVIRVINNPATF